MSSSSKSGLWNRSFGFSASKVSQHVTRGARSRLLRVEPLEDRALLAVTAEALLPDLTVWASQSRGFMYDWSVQGDELRLTTAMANIGTGRMELRGGATHGDSQDVYQRVYEPNGAFTDILAGTFIFHAGHEHIHFENFAQFRLRAVDSSQPGSVGAILSQGSKTSFCLLDVDAYNLSLPGAAQTSFYRTCGQVQGISVGWADVYDRGLEGQSIDIAGISNGTYWLEAAVDPDNRLLESNETNNVTRIQITISGRGTGTGIPQDTFESNNTFNTASILAPPEDHLYENLTIHSAGNADYYRVTATNNGPLTFRLDFQHAQGDIDMEVLNANNTRLGFSDTVTNSEQVTVQAVAGNFYFVRAYGYNNATNPNYSLFVDQPTAPGGGQAPTLTQINTLSGATADTNFTISYATLASAANEFDPEGAAISFRIGEIVSGTLTKNGAAVIPGVTLLGAGETVVWSPPTGASGTGANALSAFRVVAFDGTLESALPVLVRVDVAPVTGGIPQDTFESNNTFGTASILAPPEDHLYENLTIHSAGNADYYRVTATNNGPLTFRLDFQHTQGDIDMEVLNASNVRIGFSDTVTNSEQVTVQAVAGNLYFVRAYGYNNATNPNYSLFVDQPTAPGGGQAPTLTQINTLSGATADTNFTISYATLAAAANEFDPEGAAISFRIGEIVSGTLTKNGAAVIPGVTLLGAGETVVWSPPTGASGTGANALSAFHVTAFDGTLESALPVLVKVDVAAVNQRPTLTSIATLQGARRNTRFFISYEALLAASNAADPDGNSPLYFHVAGFNTGTLRKVNANGTISTITLGSTTIGPGESLRWTPPSNRTGTLNAFRVTVFDGQLDSTPSVLVRIRVTQ